MRGAWIGFYSPIVVGVYGAGSLAAVPWVGAAVLAAGLALAPVGAVAGAVAGGVTAEPAEKVKENEAGVARALTDLKIQEYVRGCVVSALHHQAPSTAVTVSEDAPASTLLEVTVEEFGLTDHAYLGVNPPVRFAMSERTRVIRGSDGAELYTHRLTWRGQFRPLDDWVAHEATLLKEEAGRACRDLAESLVDEVFLLYLPADGR